uniref:EGF-like domain-containing protein n=1 Tax=Strongyloides stercoralis TaxID=6248 RepID=A0A0K0ENM7_STRER
MKLFIQFYITIVLFHITINCDKHEEKAQTREYHAIDNSGINITCEVTKYNPCMHDSQCYYTNMTSEYFCKCKKCYSGQFCQDKICNLNDQNDSTAYHTVFISDYIYTSIVGVVYLFAFICTIRISRRNDKFQEKISSGEVFDSVSTTVNNKNSIVQELASNMNVDERKKNIELENYIINNTLSSEFYSVTDKNNNYEKENTYNLWDDLKMKLKNKTTKNK